MTILRATLKELDHVAEVFNLYRLFQKQESDLSGARSFIKERLEKDESVIFIACEGEEVLGIAQSYPLFSSVSMQPIWLLNDLYVKESARNKGFGKQLLQEVINFAKESGAKGVSLETGNDNFGAQRLYEGIGFVKETNYFYHLAV